MTFLSPSRPLTPSSFAALLACLVLLLSASPIFACGNGTPGGADYVPQRRGEQQQQIVQGEPLTAKQARDVVAQYVKPINPDLVVGEANDSGAYYEIDLLSKDGETVQVVGVDKYSGRLAPLS